MTVLAMMHVAKRDLGLDDDTYRAVLVRVTGKRSSKEMTDRERQAVLDEFRRQGFKPASKSSGKATKPLSGPYAKKAQALWIALWNLGAVEDRRDSALLAFVCRQTGIERTEWILDAKHGRAVIEALKAWCQREGVDWEVGTMAPDHGKRHGFQIALAQWEKLRPHEVRTMPAFWADVGFVLRRAVIIDKPTDAEWITVMNAFGKRIRAGKAGV
ncbi:regulatory protein GemA [Jiella endophytica]|uniref:Regulatory protein GemA n=1 Tax=Jiella endophytica TaxID=2558362 RepID=A0A4Y8REU9_9HYPH|nr:regulatory protein GemA [Jiella endophytica]TFF20519.1 regulatory protein GemA [Jiella endophytica]